MGDGAHAEQAWNDAVLAAPVMAPQWRLWRYDAPAVVLGRAQRADAPRLAAASALPVLSRSSGGGPVLVGPWMLGLSAALPPGHALAGGGPVDGYRWLGEGLARVLRGLGVAGALALSPQDLCTRSVDPALAWACFGGLSPWEVVVGGRKLVGLAQVRRRTGVLVVGGVLVDDPPWERLCDALGKPSEQAAALRRTTSGCREHVREQVQASDSDLASRLASAMAGLLADALGPLSPPDPVA